MDTGVRLRCVRLHAVTATPQDKSTAATGDEGFLRCGRDTAGASHPVREDGAQLGRPGGVIVLSADAMKAP
jgi:hypothetical protein